MTRSPHRLGCKRIVIARHQKNGGMETGLFAEGPGESLPKILGGGRVIEQIAGAQQGVYRVTRRDIEDRRDHFHPRARQLLLRLSGKEGKRRPRCQSAVCKSLSTMSAGS